MIQEPEFDVDSATQREVVEDPETVRKWIAHLESQGLIGEPMRVVWLRILGELDDAEALGWRVLERSGGPSRELLGSCEGLPLTAVVAAIRLAHVLQWKGEFESAHQLHDLALRAISSVEALTEDSAYADYLRPFAYQHLARCYFDQRNYEQALIASQKALQLRRELGVPADHVLYSEELLAAIKAHVNGQRDQS